MTANEAQLSPQTRSMPRKYPRPPLVPGLPLLGSALALAGDPLEFLREQHARKGTVFRFRAAHREIVVLAGVEANRFMARDGRDALISSKAWGGLADYLKAPHVISAIDGPAHLQIRTHLRNAISKQPVEEHFEDVGRLVTEVLSETLEDGELSVRDYTRRLTNAQVCFLVTGERAAISGDELSAIFEFFRYATNVLVFGKWPPLALRLPGHMKRTRMTLKKADEFIETARREGEGDNWMHLILEGAKKFPDLFTPGDLRANAILPAFAGIDTFGATNTFAIRELLRNRPVRERLMADVDAAYEANGGKLPAPNRLKEIESLNGFCLEVLRLYPVAFAMPRHAAKDFVFEGHQIREGEEVLVFTTATHTDPVYFHEPRRFDIDRYSAPRSEHRQKFAYSPYGRGPHACMGAALSELMFLITIASMVRHLDLEDLHPGKRYRTVFDPSPTLDFDFRVGFRGWRNEPA